MTDFSHISQRLASKLSISPEMSLQILQRAHTPGLEFKALTHAVRDHLRLLAHAPSLARVSEALAYALGYRSVHVAMAAYQPPFAPRTAPPEVLRLILEISMKNPTLAAMLAVVPMTVDLQQTQHWRFVDGVLRLKTFQGYAAEACMVITEALTYLAQGYPERLRSLSKTPQDALFLAFLARNLVYQTLKSPFYGTSVHFEAYLKLYGFQAPYTLEHLYAQGQALKARGVELYMGEGLSFDLGQMKSAHRDTIQQLQAYERTQYPLDLQHAPTLPGDGASKNVSNDLVGALQGPDPFQAYAAFLAHVGSIGTEDALVSLLERTCDLQEQHPTGLMARLAFGAIAEVGITRLLQLQPQEDVMRFMRHNAAYRRWHDLYDRLTKPLAYVPNATQRIKSLKRANKLQRLRAMDAA